MCLGIPAAGVLDGVGVGGGTVGVTVELGALVGTPVGGLVGPCDGVMVGALVGPCDATAVGAVDTTGVGDGCAESTVTEVGTEPPDPPPPHAQITEATATIQRSRAGHESLMHERVSSNSPFPIQKIGEISKRTSARKLHNDGRC